MNYKKNSITIPILGSVGNDVRTFADGINTIDPAHKIGKNQVRDSVNLMLDIAKRRPGMLALHYTSGVDVSDLHFDVRGMHNYLRLDGSFYMLTYTNKELRRFSRTEANDTTLLYTSDGSREAWFDNYLDKCWICNGFNNVKVEDEDNAYQIGITPPTGASATAVAGGTLADGDYKVYLCYARKVNGTIVLYSKGLDLGTVTCGSGLSSIEITSIPTSSDGQVTDVVAFCTDAGGTTYYYYGEVTNGTSQLNVSDATNRNAATIYATVAGDNNVPTAFDYIKAFDNRIWGSKSNVLYYSLQAGNVYDLERFEALALITYPFEINGIYSLGEHLYVSTPNGMIRQPYGDVAARFEQKDTRFYFKYPRTVAEYRGLLIGLTQDGVRAFDGERFSDDLTRDIKDGIERAYQGYREQYRPCGLVYRRDHRTEYHLCVRDLSFQQTFDVQTFDPLVPHKNLNNVRWVLNLDRLVIEGGKIIRAPWEKWSVAANYLVADSDNVLWGAQRVLDHGRSSDGLKNVDGQTIVFKERSPEQEIIDERVVTNGYWPGNTFVPKLELTTATYIPDISSVMRMEQCRVLCQHRVNYKIKIVMDSNPRVDEIKTPTRPTTYGFVLGVDKLNVDTFATTDPIPIELKLKRLRGRNVYVYIEQEKNALASTLYPINYQLLELYLTGIIKRSRFT